MEAFRRGWRLIPERRRFFAARVLGFMCFMPVLELGGIGMIFAFVQGVAQPEKLAQSLFYQKINAAFGLGDKDALIYFGVLTIAVLLVRNAAASFNAWQLARFNCTMADDLSVRMLRGYLAQPLLFFAKVNTAALGKNVLIESSQLVSGLVVSVLTIVADTLMIAVIVGGLLYAEPVATVFAVGILAVLYVSVSRITKRMATRLGQERMRINAERYTCAAQALHGVRELRVLGKVDSFLVIFRVVCGRLADVLVKQAVMVALPRNILEVVVFGGIVALVTVKLASGTAAAEVIGLISLYALAIYRLMPSADRLLKQFNMIHSTSGLMDEVRDILAAGELAERSPSEVSRERLPFVHAIDLEDLEFKYPGQTEMQIAGLSASVRPSESIAFVGSSGAGKTTLINIILGLLRPTGGRMVVDGQPVTDELIPAWQRNIGYVPQDIFLIDDTVTRNIALGVPDEEIDHEAVRNAARLARLHEFVMTELAEGYETVVGERGVRLSGGQRQRIGIARALYHDPSVLVFDEATSALDGITEREITTAIGELGKRKAVILVAHRLTTVRDCDRIYLLDRGRISDVGRFEDLITRNETFRQMARET